MTSSAASIAVIGGGITGVTTAVTVANGAAEGGGHVSHQFDGLVVCAGVESRRFLRRIGRQNPARRHALRLAIPRPEQMDRLPRRQRRTHLISRHRRAAGSLVGK